MFSRLSRLSRPICCSSAGGFVSVSASFIEGLLSTSEGDSNAGRSGDDVSQSSDHAGEASAEAGGEANDREQRGNIGSKEPASAGSESAAKPEAIADAGQRTDHPVVEAAKPPATDDPVTQIGRLNGALREVRGENKDLKSQLGKYNEQLTAMQQRIDALAQPKPPVVEPDVEPDFLSEPKAYVDKTLAKAQEAVKKLQDGETQRAEQTKQQEQMHQQWGDVLAKEAEFTAETPDYQDALQFVRGIRINAYSAEFEALNDRAPTPQEVNKALTTQEIQGALLLQSKGKNPAQWYYGYAQKMGYKKADPAGAEVVEPPVVVAPAAKPPAAKPDKEAVKSMGSGGSSAAPADEDANRDPMAGLLGAVHAELTAKRKGRRG